MAEFIKDRNPCAALGFEENAMKIRAAAAKVFDNHAATFWPRAVVKFRPRRGVAVVQKMLRSSACGTAFVLAAAALAYVCVNVEAEGDACARDTNREELNVSQDEPGHGGHHDAMLTGAAYADPIEGNWKTEAGSTAAIAPCGGSFCITLKDRQACRQEDRHVQGRRRQRLFGQDHRPRQRQDLYRQGQRRRLQCSR